MTADFDDPTPKVKRHLCAHLSTAERAAARSASESAKIATSSAYIKRWMRGSPDPVPSLTPGVAARISEARSSIKTRNSRGDKMAPWRTPCSSHHGSVSRSPVRKRAEVPLRRSLHSIHTEPRMPRCQSLSSRPARQTVSNAFRISIKATRVRRDLPGSKRRNRRDSVNTHDCSSAPNLNPAWASVKPGSRRLVRRGRSRRSKNLLKHDSKVMGRQFSKQRASPGFGIGTMMPRFQDAGA